MKKKKKAWEDENKTRKILMKQENEDETWIKESARKNKYKNKQIKTQKTTSANLIKKEENENKNGKA